MNRKTFEMLSYVAIGIIFIFLLLMIFEVVPTSWFIYILGVSIVLLIVRLVFRVYFVMQDRKQKGG